MAQKLNDYTESSFRPDRKTFERLYEQLCVMRTFLTFRSGAGSAKTDGALILEAILDMV